MKNKRGMSAWIWILIVMALIGLGVGIYFLVSGSVPTPPSLPLG
jgi:uncharacterized membrane protein YczE